MKDWGTLSARAEVISVAYAGLPPLFLSEVKIRSEERDPALPAGHPSVFRESGRYGRLSHKWLITEI